ncbi:MAG: hypothetical protein AAGA90_17885 [Actinomycetota bacterium]
MSLTNLVVLHGILSSDPRTRTLPSGDELISYEITTETDDGRASVPVVWFSPRRPPAVHTGDTVVAIGVVRRRFFRAGAAAMSRTEVVADLVARPHSRTVQRAIDTLVPLLAEQGTTDGHAPAGGSPQPSGAR